MKPMTYNNMLVAMLVLGQDYYNDDCYGGTTPTQGYQIKLNRHHTIKTGVKKMLCR